MKRKRQPSNGHRKKREQRTKPHERIKEFEKQDWGLRSRYRGECLLKDLLPDEPCTELAWNHTIGRQFLREITSKDRRIQYWDIFSGKMLAIQSMGAKKLLGERLPQDINEFKPSELGIDNFHCKIKGACNRHDHKAFEEIETPSLLRGNDPDHQTRMAIRAAFAETAFLSNTELWIYDNRRKHHSIETEWIRIKNLRDSSHDRLRAWVQLLVANKTTQVSTEYLKEQLPIRMAVCGTFARTAVRSPATFSLMPRIDGLTDILISTRTDESGTRTQQQNEQTEILMALVPLLKKKPSDAIKQLIRMTDQIFLNPEDYDDQSIISEAEKLDLEEAIAKYRAEESLTMTQGAGIRFGRN